MHVLMLASVVTIMGALCAAEPEVKREIESEQKQECAMHSPDGLTQALMYSRYADTLLTSRILTAVGLMPNSPYALVGTHDSGTVAVHVRKGWSERIPNGKLGLLGAAVTHIACAAHDRRFAIASPRSVAIGTFDVLEDGCDYSASSWPVEHRIRALTFDPAGSSVAAGCHDGSVCIWDVERTEPSVVFAQSRTLAPERPIPTYALAYIARDVICCNSSPKDIVVCDLRAKERVGLKNQQSSLICVLAASIAHGYIVAGESDGILRLYDMRRIGTDWASLFTAIKSPVVSLACHPVYHALWAGYEDGSCILTRYHDLQDGRGVRKIHRGPVSAIAVSESHDHAVSVGWNGAMYFWGPRLQLERDRPSQKQSTASSQRRRTGLQWRRRA